MFSSEELAQESIDKGWGEDVEEWTLDAEKDRIPHQVWLSRIRLLDGMIDNLGTDSQLQVPQNELRTEYELNRLKPGHPQEPISILASSPESREHAEKLAVEARQAWLLRLTEGEKEVGL